MSFNSYKALVEKHNPALFAYLNSHTMFHSLKWYQDVAHYLVMDGDSTSELAKATQAKLMESPYTGFPLPTQKNDTMESEGHWNHMMTQEQRESMSVKSETTVNEIPDGRWHHMTMASQRTNQSPKETPMNTDVSEGRWIHMVKASERAKMQTPKSSTTIKVDLSEKSTVKQVELG